jgi:protein-S-isoprenylcysteine O-methyltransferase Ste14
MGRILALLYGLATYLFFLATFLYAMGFVIGIAVPKTIDTGPAVPVAEAIAVDLALLALFAVQHSVMARAAFKKWWTRIVPEAIERSTYVLLATLALALLLWQWRPIPFVVWQATNPVLANVLMGVGLLGWLIAVVSTFLIDHFELFGLRQIGIDLAGRKISAPRFKTPALYKIVRHPLYFGFLLAFWSAPLMTAGHLLFAAGMTVYIFVGTLLEERDLIRQFGEDYRRYRKRVAMLIPMRWGM